MANCLIDTVANLLTLTNVSDSLIHVELDYLKESSNPDFHRNSFGFFSEKKQLSDALWRWIQKQTIA